jgi:dihydrofolate reductase
MNESRRVTVRRITVGAFVSMDGVMQGPGGPSEDPTRGFKFGGWVTPYFDEVFGEEVDRLFREKCDLLLGRKTFEIFAAHWPYYDEAAPDGGIARLFNDITKYVVSRSGDVDTSWRGSVLLRDIAEVKRLREEARRRQEAVRGRLCPAQLQADRIASLEHRPGDRALRAARRHPDWRHGAGRAE